MALYQMDLLSPEKWDLLYYPYFRKKIDQSYKMSQIMSDLFQINPFSSVSHLPSFY